MERRWKVRILNTKNKRKKTVMMTLRQFSAEPSAIPTITSWYLADLSKAQGKQELFTHQLPQKLKILREHALIESAISSQKIAQLRCQSIRNFDENKESNQSFYGEACSG